MKTYRFTLEKYSGSSSRYYCPQCKQKEFVRYIDNLNIEPFPDNVGRCNRIEKCGYHFTPKQYFQELDFIPKRLPNKIIFDTKSIGYCNENLLIESLQTPEKKCNLTEFLEQYFRKDLIQKCIKKYLLGTSQIWNGSTIFWQLDRNKNIRCGKTMLYNKSDGKRYKNKHYWIKNESYNLKMEQCFFGTHLIDYFPDYPIGIVESEKTAIISDLFFDEKIIWISSGGLHGLNEKKFMDLIGRNVILFPDLSPPNSKINAFELWKFKAKTISKNLKIDIKINNFLELNSSISEKENQNDLADFILKNQEKKLRRTQMKL